MADVRLVGGQNVSGVFDELEAGIRDPARDCPPVFRRHQVVLVAMDHESWNFDGRQTTK